MQTPLSLNNWGIPLIETPIEAIKKGAAQLSKVFFRFFEGLNVTVRSIEVSV